MACPYHAISPGCTAANLASRDSSRSSSSLKCIAFFFVGLFILLFARLFFFQALLFFARAAPYGLRVASNVAMPTPSIYSLVSCPGIHTTFAPMYDLRNCARANNKRFHFGSYGMRWSQSCFARGTKMVRIKQPKLPFEAGALHVKCP